MIDFCVFSGFAIHSLFQFWAFSTHPRAAGEQCGLKPGQVIDYMDKGNDNRRACSLYLSIMDRMGVTLDRFGDSDKRLVNL